MFVTYNLYKYRRIHKVLVKDKINQLECHLDISVQNLGSKKFSNMPTLYYKCLPKIIIDSLGLI